MSGCALERLEGGYRGGAFGLGLGALVAGLLDHRGRGLVGVAGVVEAGVAVRIKQLCAAPEVRDRLREMGLGEDQIIKLVTSRTNFICQVCNARFAISEQLAQLILVEPVGADVT